MSIKSPADKTDEWDARPGRNVIEQVPDGKGGYRFVARQPAPPVAEPESVSDVRTLHLDALEHLNTMVQETLAAAAKACSADPRLTAIARTDLEKAFVMAKHALLSGK